MIKVFAYGTLLYRNVVETVLGHRWPANYTPYTLENYCKLPTAPSFIVPAYGHSVKGAILNDLDTSDLEALDHYEGVANNLYVLRAKVIPDHGLIYFYVAGRGVIAHLTTILQDSEFITILQEYSEGITN